jgi:putative tributyrin esterase
MAVRRGGSRRQHARLLLSLLFPLATLHAQPAPVRGAGSVHTDTMFAQSLGTRKQIVIYLPPSYASSAARAQRFPLAVYLHGGLGNERDWTEQGGLAATMDSLVAGGMPEMIVVMPDGDDGWWTTWNSLNDVAACRRAPRRESPDSYCVPWPKYDDYVARDVVAHVDSAYRTLTGVGSRAIAGLSMGGYGAISIAARYPDTFAVAVSHSGVLRPALMIDSSTVATTGAVTIRDASTPAELRNVSGARWERIQPAFGTDSMSWMARDPARLVERLLAVGGTVPALFVDVGSEDYLLPMNRAFRDRMAELHVAVQYAEWSGRHEWVYWRTHLAEGLRFIAARLQHAPE